MFSNRNVNAQYISEKQNSLTSPSYFQSHITKTKKRNSSCSASNCISRDNTGTHSRSEKTTKTGRQASKLCPSSWTCARWDKEVKNEWSEQKTVTDLRCDDKTADVLTPRPVEMKNTLDLSLSETDAERVDGRKWVISAGGRVWERRFLGHTHTRVHTVHVRLKTNTHGDASDKMCDITAVRYLTHMLGSVFCFHYDFTHFTTFSLTFL